MPSTAVPIPEHALSHPHVPIANSGDGTDERNVEAPRSMYVISLSGGSSPHELHGTTKEGEDNTEYVRSASGVSNASQSTSQSRSQGASFSESTTTSESDQITSSSSAESSRNANQDDWFGNFRTGAQQGSSERRPFSEFASSTFEGDARTTSSFLTGRSESSSHTASQKASSFISSMRGGQNQRLSETERNTAINAASGTAALPGSFPATEGESSSSFFGTSGGESSSTFFGRSGEESSSSLFKSTSDESTFFGESGSDTFTSGAVDEVEAKKDGKDFPGMSSDEPLSPMMER